MICKWFPQADECDRCWELRTRVEADPRLALMMMGRQFAGLWEEWQRLAGSLGDFAGFIEWLDRERGLTGFPVASLIEVGTKFEQAYPMQKKLDGWTFEAQGGKDAAK